MTTKQDYHNFKHNTLANWCWACGRDDVQIPDGWFAEWFIDRAHVVNKPRVEDIRLVVLLCRLCHGRFAGLRFANIEGNDLPSLTVGNLLWLKKHFDPLNFDRAFLRRYSVQRLPRAIRPPEEYLDSYAMRHPGEVLVG